MLYRWSIFVQEKVVERKTYLSQFATILQIGQPWTILDDWKPSLDYANSPFHHISCPLLGLVECLNALIFIFQCLREWSDDQVNQSDSESADLDEAPILPVADAGQPITLENLQRPLRQMDAPATNRILLEKYF